MTMLELLKTVSFGQRVAEDEGDLLEGYFVETDDWHRLFGDAVDIVYGPKGAGKSALYSLLMARRTDLFDHGVLLAAAEHPRGAPAFRALVTDPPASEREFIALWKLYLACLASATLTEFGISGASADRLRAQLEESGLKPKDGSLQRLLHSAFEYVKRMLRPTGIEGGIKLDPATQVPTGLTAKILFGEPSPEQARAGVVSVDELLRLADAALAASGYRLWILLDRLDVAFSDSADLEQNALRALFHVYLDLQANTSLRLKIFLRTDIWRRITTSGFREASHITRHLTIDWSHASLLNLVVRRVVQNGPVLDHYGVARDAILESANSQESFFYLVFPTQVEVGTRKPNTFDWMLGRTCDATKQTAPRELIHLLTSLREVQVRRLEVGEPEPEGGRLFARTVFKDALTGVSRTRLEQTLYAEYPDERPLIEVLRGEKTQHTLTTLAEIWQVEPPSALGPCQPP